MMTQLIKLSRRWAGNAIVCLSLFALGCPPVDPIRKTVIIKIERRTNIRGDSYIIYDHIDETNHTWRHRGTVDIGLKVGDVARIIWNRDGWELTKTSIDGVKVEKQ
jgi:hypothetical protein